MAQLIWRLFVSCAVYFTRQNAPPRCRFVLGAKLARRKPVHLQNAPNAGRIASGTRGVATVELVSDTCINLAIDYCMIQTDTHTIRTNAYFAILVRSKI